MKVYDSTTEAWVTPSKTSVFDGTTNKWKEPTKIFVYNINAWTEVTPPPEITRIIVLDCKDGTAWADTDPDPDGPAVDSFGNVRTLNSRQYEFFEEQIGNIFVYRLWLLEYEYSFWGPGSDIWREIKQDAGATYNIEYNYRLKKWQAGSLVDLPSVAFQPNDSRVYLYEQPTNSRPIILAQFNNPYLIDLSSRAPELY
jgi:hypothetical protein